MVSLEAFVAVNFFMNLLVLAIAVRRSGHVRWRRILAGSTLAAGYAILAYAVPNGILLTAWAQAAMLGGLAAILFSGRGRKVWLSGIVRLITGYAFAGGCVLLSRTLFPGGSHHLVWGGLGVLISLLLPGGPGGEETLHRQQLLRVRLETRMGAAEFEALIDTGNGLTEPLSGLPVLIVGRKYLAGLMDERCLAPDSGYFPVGFRKVRYGTLNGSGEMKCFRPESVLIWQNGAWVNGVDIWAAIYPGELPGNMNALAPPAMALPAVKRNR